MKILNCFPEATNPNHYAYSNIRSSLRERGCSIVDFDFLGAMQQYGQSGMVSQLRNLIDRDRPDIFLHGIVTDELPVSFLDELRDRNDILSVVYFSDDDWRIHNHSIHWVEHYNFATTNDINAIEVYRRAGFNHVFHLQYAANPRIYYPREVPKQYAVTFVGQAYLGRPQLLYQLMIKGIDLRIWGSGWDNIPELKVITGPSLPTEKMIETFCASKIVLGLSWCSIPTTNGDLMPQIKGRTFEYPACRAFQITCADNRLGNYFTIDKEIVTYRDINELIEKIHYYLVHDQEREEIAEAGYQKVITQHTWSHRWDAFFHFLGNRGVLTNKEPITLTSRKQDLVEKNNREAEVVKSPNLPTKSYFPLVSVYCFVYNREKYIVQTIESVVKQTYQNWEMVILDDGSTDQTEAIIRKYLYDPRIKYYYQDNIGQSMNRFHELNNRAIDFTNGELICAIGVDDVFLPLKIERQVLEFEQFPELDISFCNAQIIDQNGRPLSSEFRHPRTVLFHRSNILRWLFTTNFIPHPSTMIRRRSFYNSNRYETGFASDYHFWLKTAQTLNFKYLDEKLWYYRVHDEGLSTAGKYASFCAQATFEVLNEMYGKYSIEDFYPEIRLCGDQQRAAYSAHLDFGNDMIKGQFYRLPYFAVQEYKGALAYRPDGIEALNNLFLAYLKLKDLKEAENALNALRPYASNNEMVARNIAVYENTPADQSLQGQYILLHEQQSELSQKISQEAQNPNLLAGSTLTRKSLKASSQDSMDFITQALETANQYLKEDRREKAIQLLEDLVAQFPDVAVVRAGLGATLLAAGAYSQAITHLQKALDGLPEETGIHLQLAEAYYHGGQFPEAVQTLENLLKDHPDNINALLRLGEIFQALGQDANRAAVLLKAVRISPLHPEVLAAFGQLGMDTGNQDVFQTAFQKLEEVAPQHPIFKTWQAALRPPKVPAADEKCSKKADSDEDVFSGHPSPAQSSSSGLTSIILSLSPNNLHLDRCVSALQTYTPEPYEVFIIGTDDLSDRINWLKEKIIDGRQWKCLLSPREMGSPKRINRAFKEASGDHLVFLSDQVLVSQDWLSGLQECLHSAPEAGLVGPMTVNLENAQAVPEDQVRSLTDLDRFSSSFRQENRYRRIPTRSLSPVCLLFKRHLVEETGSLDETLEGEGIEWEDFCTRISLEGYQLWIAGDVFVYNDQKPPSVNKKSFKTKWTGIDSQTELGQKIARFNAIQNGKDYYQEGQIDKALETLIEGIKYCPEEKKIYWTLAEILIDAGRFSEGLEALSGLPAPFKEEPRSLVLFGYGRQGLGDLEEAEEYGQGALQRQADYPSALNLLGRIAQKKGNLKSASDFYRAAIQADPGYGEPYANLGALLWQSREEEKALEWMEKGARLSPTTSDVLSLYQTLIAELGRYEQAESILRSAVASHQNHKKLSFSLIGNLLSQNKHRDAMKEIERAMITFGIDEGILTAALEVRNKIGPMTISPTTSAQGTLSVCMIVKNEEEHLPRCLMSLKPVADEIIIVDTGSYDRTREIAEAFGAKVYDYKWTNDFSAARNYSLNKGTGQWILVHDADEVISSLDYDKLRQVLNQKPAEFLAYSIITRNYSNNSSLDGWTANAGKYPDEETAMGWYPTPKVRLYTNHPRIRFQNPVHELLEPSLLEAKIPIISLDIPVHHYGELNQEKDQSKAETYYVLGKKKLAANPDNPKALLELAIQAGELKKYGEAVELFERYLQKVPESHTAWFNLATCYLELEKFQPAMDAARRAKELAPRANEVMLTYAGVSFCAGDVSEAISVLEGLLKKAPDYPVAKASLGAAYYLGGKKEKGEKCLNDLWRRGFDCNLALHSISKKLIAVGRNKQARDLLQGMMTTRHIHPETRDLLAQLETRVEEG